MAMTTTRRVGYEPEDITGVRLRCANCRVSLVLELDETATLPSDCPVCQQAWGTAKAPGAVLHARALFEAVKALRRAPSPAVRISLEYDDVR